MKRLLLSLALLLTIWATCASAQVVFDAQSTGVCDTGVSNVTTIATCAKITVGSGSNRALVCGISWSGAVTSPSMHWDSAGTNQALTAVPGATATSTREVLWFGLVAPTSGAKNLTASWTGSQQAAMACVAYTGVDQTGGATSFPNGNGATGTSATASVTITSVTDDAVVANHTNNNNATATNNTNVYLDIAQAGQDSGMNRAAGAASVAMTMTLGASVAFASAGTSVHAAGAGGGCTAPPNQLLMLGVGNCKGH